MSVDLSPREIGQKIYLVRDQQVMLDTDLAYLYEIETLNLNKSVKRNRDHFPDDFTFQFTRDEWISLTFQIGMSKGSGRGGRRTVPFAFTQEGIAMLSSILRSERAREINIAIQRGFAKLRKVTDSSSQLGEKIDQLETTLNLRIESISNCLTQVMVAVGAISKPVVEEAPELPSISSQYLEGPGMQPPSKAQLKKRANLQIDAIQEAVLQYYEVSLQDLQSESRSASVSRPRQICMFLVRKHSGISFQKIGTLFGGRDHSTVLHACNRIQSQLLSDEETREALISIESCLADRGLCPKNLI